MTALHCGPVHLEIEVPAGWTLRRTAEPQVEPFRRPPSAEAGGLSLTVSLDTEARNGPPGHDLAVTTGWRLERVGERFRWTLPDGRGHWGGERDRPRTRLPLRD